MSYFGETSSSPKAVCYASVFRIELEIFSAGTSM